MSSINYIDNYLFHRQYSNFFGLVSIKQNPKYILTIMIETI